MYPRRSPIRQSFYGVIFASINIMHKKNTQNLSIDPDKPCPQQQRCACPYWAATSKACLLVKDGLFLPVQAHISAYCSSQYYPSCHHYQLLSPLQEELPTTEQSSSNRRRSIRVPRYQIFRFAEINTSGKLPENRLEETWTIDISKHGARFATYRYLKPNTLIRFTLEGENELNITQGQGRIVWTEPIEKTSLFHAGISFSEPPQA